MENIKGEEILINNQRKRKKIGARVEKSMKNLIRIMLFY